jgi:primosomal replication protein N''
MLMITNDKNLFNQLAQQLEQLSQKIACITDNETEYLFDPHLFQPPANNKGQLSVLQYYLDQIKKNVDYLKQMVDKAQLEKVAYLTEKITNQIIAMHRELATQSLREISSVKVQETRYETHCRYLDYQRRLNSMKQELESALNTTVQLTQRQQIIQKIAALDGRLYRCQQAIAKLEKQLEHDNVNFNE